MAKHDWTASNLGHGTLMCRCCHATDAELRALGEIDRCPGILDTPPDHHAIETRLRIALGRFEDYLGRDRTAADRELIHSVSVALQGVSGSATLPRHDVVQTIRTLVGEIEETNLPLDQIEEARAAYGDLCEAWGFLLVDGQPSAAPASRPVHAAALAGHLATLIELHHDDDRDQQNPDPIRDAYHPPELSSLRLTTESGRQFMVSIVELPA